MARDWTDTKAIREAILDRMDLYGENVAAVPFSMYQERDHGNILKWVVDIHVKVRRVTEFEITGEGPTCGEALRRAYLALNNQPMVLKNAARTNSTFGVAV